MKQGQKFSDERVRFIKELLIQGTHPRAIARMEGCNTNTILRIRDGDTYAGVKVAGEEGMRPPLEVRDYRPVGVQVSDRAIQAVGVMPPQEEIDAMEKRLLVVQAEVDRKKAAVEVGNASGEIVMRGPVPVVDLTEVPKAVADFAASVFGTK